MEDVNIVSTPNNRTPEEIEAHVQLLRAKAEREKAETRIALADAKTAEYRARMAKIDLDKKEDVRQAELASDVYHKVFFFTKEVTDASAHELIDRLAYWERSAPKGKPKGKPEDDPLSVEIVFSSPGGSIIPGLMLFDYIEAMGRRGIHVTTTALGYAASMAGILLQAGQVRRMGKESWVLIHQASFGAIGSFGEVADRVKWVERIQERILDIFADRAARSNAPKPITRREIKKNWERKDWWLTSDECLKYGIVDEIV